MKKIILSVAVSLDGFIEGPNGEYDWCPPPSKSEMDTFLGNIDTIFMGRKSFEMMGGSAFPDKKNYVFSNTLKTTKAKNVEIVSGDVVKAVKKIQAEEGKDIWLFGGASLTTTFMNENLVDEMWLGLVPVVLGAGKPLFQGIQQRNYFRFTEAVGKTGYVSLALQREKQKVKKIKKTDQVITDLVETKK